MTDQQIVAGGGKNAEASGTLGLNFFGLSDGHMQTVASYPNVGQGSGAVAWLTGSFQGGSTDDIAQLWDNGGSLGLIFYGFSDGQLQTVASYPDLGQGSGAVAWLAGNFLGGSLDEIAQLWDNGGRIGVNLYGPTGFMFSFPDLGQGAGAVAWLGGDFTGSGSHEIAQLWDNNGTLGLNVYRMVGETMQTVIESSDLGQGSGAVAWLTGNFTGSGTDEIAQLWDNNGTLGLIVYSMAGGTVQTLIDSSDLGQGSDAVAWLAGDFFPSALMQIAQLWDNNGTLGLVVYGVGNGYAQTLFGSSDLGEGSGAVAWLAGDFSESVSTQIAQLWDDDGTLTVSIYEDDGNGNLGLNPFRGGNLGQGPGALAWLTGDFTGSGLTQIAQPWDN
jgi:hypothetical protein